MNVQSGVVLLQNGPTGTHTEQPLQINTVISDCFAVAHTATQHKGMHTLDHYHHRTRPLYRAQKHSEKPNPTTPQNVNGETT